jgi:hypothetical protein
VSNALLRSRTVEQAGHLIPDDQAGDLGQLLTEFASAQKV